MRAGSPQRIRRPRPTEQNVVRATITMLQLIDIFWRVTSATRVRRVCRAKRVARKGASRTRRGWRGCAGALVTPACSTCAVSGCTADREFRDSQANRRAISSWSHVKQSSDPFETDLTLSNESLLNRVLSIRVDDVTAIAGYCIFGEREGSSSCTHLQLPPFVHSCWFFAYRRVTVECTCECTSCTCEKVTVAEEEGKKRAAVRRVAARFTNLWSLSGCRWSPWRRRLETVDRETGRAASRPRFRGTRLPTLDNRDKLVYDGQRNNTETVQVRDRSVASRLFLKNTCCENQSSAGHEAALCFPTKYLNSSYDDFVKRSSRLLLDIGIWLVEIETVCEDRRGKTRWVTFLISLWGISFQIISEACQIVSSRWRYYQYRCRWCYIVGFLI